MEHTQQPVQQQLPPHHLGWEVTVAGQCVGELVQVGLNELIDFAHRDCPVGEERGELWYTETSDLLVGAVPVIKASQAAEVLL